MSGKRTKAGRKQALRAKDRRRMAQKHAKQTEAEDAFQEAFDKAQGADGWMAAVWEVRNGRLTLTQRTTFNFGRGDFATAQAQLKEVCDKDIDMPAAPAALPQAHMDKIRNHMPAGLAARLGLGSQEPAPPAPAEVTAGDRPVGPCKFVYDNIEYTLQPFERVSHFFMGKPVIVRTADVDVPVRDTLVDKVNVSMAPSQPTRGSTPGPEEFPAEDYPAPAPKSDI